MVNKFSITILFCLASYLFSFSQTKKNITTQKTNESISIDADLNEVSWKNAEIATDFVSLEPKNGTPIPEEFKTEEIKKAILDEKQIQDTHKRKYLEECQIQ
jgi:hypothetical protein